MRVASVSRSLLLCTQLLHAAPVVPVSSAATSVTNFPSDTARSNALVIAVFDLAKNGDAIALSNTVARERWLLHVRNAENFTLLHISAASANADAVRSLISLGAELDAMGGRDWNTGTPLITALKPYSSIMRWRIGQAPMPTGMLAVANAMVSAGARLFRTNGDQRDQVFSGFAFQSDTAMFDLLLTNASAKSFNDPSSNSPLHYAALAGRSNVMDVLAQRPNVFAQTNHAGLTPLQAVSARERSFVVAFNRPPSLFELAEAQQQSIAKHLVRLGAPVDSCSATGLGWTNELAAMLATNAALASRPDGRGRVPLHWAVVRADETCVRLLLRAGASLNASDRNGQTPYDLALEGNRTELAMFFATNNARLGTNSLPPLHWAARNSNPKLARFLLSRGAAVNGTNTAGETALHISIRQQQLGFVQLLLEHRADINARDTNGDTVLLQHCRATKDVAVLPPADSWLAKGLSKLRANPTAQKFVPTPSWTLPQTNGIFEFLLRHGAKANVTNALGETALHLVAEKDFSSINKTNAAAAAQEWIGQLLRHGANVNARTLKKDTPLHRAIAANNTLAALALLSRGAQPNARDGSGDLPLAMTMSRLPEVFAALLRHGANPNLTNSAGEFPLGRALLDANVPNVEALLTNGADPNLLFTRTPHGIAAPILVAVETEHSAKLLPLLHKHRLDLDRTANTNGDTLVHLAALRCEHRRINALIAAGASPNVANVSGDFPLHVATDVPEMGLNRRPGRGGVRVQPQAKVETIRVLLKGGAKADARNRFGQTALHLLAGSSGGGSFDGAELLVNAGADVNARDANGNTPLHDVASGPLFSKLAEWLVTHGAQRGVTNDAGLTPLAVSRSGTLSPMTPRALSPSNSLPNGVASAAARGDLAEVRRFIEADIAFADQEDLSGETPLAAATRGGHTNVMQLLLTRGVNPDTGRRSNDAPPPPTSGPEWVAAKRREFQSRRNGAPLQVAVATGNRDAAKLLVDSGAHPDVFCAAYLNDVARLSTALANEPSQLVSRTNVAAGVGSNRKQINGTALHFALHGGAFDTLNDLVARGADWRIQDNVGRDALALAVQLRASNAVTLLTSRAARLDLCSAATVGDLPTVKRLVAEHPRGVNETNQIGRTALAIATIRNDVPMIQFLLAHGADVSIGDVDHNTPLHFAADGGHVEVSELVLNSRLVAATNRFGETPLHRAASRDAAAVAKKLIAAGADVNAMGRSGSVLHVCARTSATNVARLLGEHGVRVNVTNASGMTPLHFAASAASVAMTVWLIEHGAHVNAKSASGETPLDAALFRPGPARPLLTNDPVAMCVKLLREHGGTVSGSARRGFPAAAVRSPGTARE